MPTSCAHAEEIAWHTQLLPNAEPANDLAGSVQRQSRRGGTAITTYTPHTQHSFAAPLRCSISSG
jgi:UTP:GlnB (protein PII) uridylyltransferase